MIKKLIFFALASVMVGSSALAYEATPMSSSSGEEQATQNVAEPMWWHHDSDSDQARPVCPKHYLVARKHCWDKAHWRFYHCGYICIEQVKTRPGEGGKDHGSHRGR